MCTTNRSEPLTRLKLSGGQPDTRKGPKGTVQPTGRQINPTEKWTCQRAAIDRRRGHRPSQPCAHAEGCRRPSQPCAYAEGRHRPSQPCAYAEGRHRPSQPCAYAEGRYSQPCAYAGGRHRRRHCRCRRHHPSQPCALVAERAIVGGQRGGRGAAQGARGVLACVDTRGAWARRAARAHHHPSADCGALCGAARLGGVRGGVG
eukprot:359300-Chlamydomonas_euryale.AAC.3